MNPFIHHFQRFTKYDLTALGVCADDVGCILHDRRLLHGMWRGFRAAETLAWLRLKPHKRVIVPLEAMFTEQLRADTAQWLAKTIGDWAGFMIQDKAEYLGVVLGPAATEHDYWRAAAAKCFARVLVICNNFAPRLGLFVPAKRGLSTRFCISHHRPSLEMTFCRLRAGPTYGLAP